MSLGTALKLRALDFAKDDIASLVFAFELPTAIVPIPNGSVFSFDATTKSFGERHVAATLVRADGDEMGGSLKPPAENRIIYIFKFSDQDKEALREAQTWMRDVKSKTEEAGGILSISIGPNFCKLSNIDEKRTTYSVHIALPDSANLEPLINNQNLDRTLVDVGKTALPICEGASG